MKRDFLSFYRLSLSVFLVVPSDQIKATQKILFFTLRGHVEQFTNLNSSGEFTIQFVFQFRIRIFRQHYVIPYSVL